MSMIATTENHSLLPTVLPNGLQGEVLIPGDKSISHRSLMFGSLVETPVEVVGLLPSADVFSTRDCLRQLGASITCQDEATGRWLVTGKRQWQTPTDVLNCGNSGTTIRLMMGLVAGQNIYAVMSGDSSLNKRPMGRVIEPLAQLGVEWKGRENNRLAPVVHLPRLEAKKALGGVHYTMPIASAQVKSAILLAGLYSGETVTVVEPLPSRDHTERMLSAMGANLTVEGTTITLAPNQAQHLKPCDWLVPGDPSSAAFLMVAGALMPQSNLLLKNVGLNPNRTGLLLALQAIGADITLENERIVGGEPVGDVRVRYRELTGNLTLQATDIPALVDEIPILMVAGLYLQGTLHVSGAEELRKKESDRLLAMQTELGKLGVTMQLFEDGFTLEGNPEFVANSPESSLATWHDHRIAMALTVLNLVQNARHPKESAVWALEDPTIVNVSFPSFFETLAGLAE
ncbi:MAG: 3-phosphoshikimate 1-carboxyvinyltransferase [Candidatus Melainabacteria bacterium]|jgi:3-phosphoshikimate 1-carboxyvinyltransferase|nr:3-phosphoshikimate 1-carboxyvinyltransferase [Candidatus Melainabacteria bacterium]